MHPKNKHITALIAVHNRLEMTRRCVECLRVAAAGAARLEIVIVDDASTDGTGEWLQGQPDVIVLNGTGDLWFGGATDLGLRHLLRQEDPPDFVLFINNDTFLRVGSLQRMLGESALDRVVGTTYWTEDRGRVGCTGFLWRRGRGMVEANTVPEWSAVQGNHARRVDAICTTVVLVPFSLLRKTTLPDPSRHPHNRYDAILSARLRRAGASFVCVPEQLADHVYGPMGNRPSVRTMRLGRYWREALRERRSTFHLTGGLGLAWESAPSRAEAVLAVAREMGRFCRQLVWVTINSLRRQTATVIH